MSKLTSKEFKKLLTEWNDYISERSVGAFGNFTGMTGDQMKFVKTVPVGLNLYTVGDYYVDNKSRLTISYILLKSMKNSKNFLYADDNRSVVLDKKAVPEIVEVLEFLLGESSFSYEDSDNNIVIDKEIKENLKVHIEQMKEDISSLATDKNGIMLYFARMDSYPDSLADGSMNKIGNVTNPNIWKNSLSWELKHDVFHYFESILEEVKSESYSFLREKFQSNKRIYAVIVNFVVPDQELKAPPSMSFGSSLLSGDNFATVIPYIRSLENNEDNKKAFVDKCLKIADKINVKLSENDLIDLKLFFEKSHACYKEIEDELKDKIVIQLPHG